MRGFISDLAIRVHRKDGFCYHARQAHDGNPSPLNYVSTNGRGLPDDNSPMYTGLNTAAGRSVRLLPAWLAPNFV